MDLWNLAEKITVKKYNILKCEMFTGQYILRNAQGNQTRLPRNLSISLTELISLVIYEC